MKRICAVFALCFAACNKTPPDAAVPPPPPFLPDGVYHVTVDPVENTCEHYFYATGWSGRYEVMRRMDGLYDVGNYADFAPWPLGFKGIAIDDGIIDHAEQWRSGYSDRFFNQSIAGTVTREEIDVEVRMDWEKKADLTPCVQRARVHGSAWRLTDPASTDGRYRVLVSQYGPDEVICDGDTPEEQPLGYYLLDVIQPVAGGSFKISFIDAALRGDLPAPAADGTIKTGKGFGYLLDWQKFVGFAPTWSSVEGIVRPERLDLILEFSDFQNVPCVHRFHAVGAKNLPGPNNVTGEYRSSCSVLDVCAGRTEVYQDRYSVVDQGDGHIVLTDSFGFAYFLKVAADGSFHAVFDSNGENSVYDGRTSPPLLNFVTTFRSAGDSYKCALINTVSAHSRFVDDP